MLTRKSIAIFFIFLTTVFFKPVVTKAISADSLTIIPQPMSIQTQEGAFYIRKNTQVLAQKGDAAAIKIAASLAARLNNTKGFALSAIQAEAPAVNSIFFSTLDSDTSLGKEGYKITVNEAGVKIFASTANGLFYGLQTLYQLLPPEIENKTPNDVVWIVPYLEIRDMPRFQWRGLHLDVSRHFMPVDFIKKYIDNMAMHKLNVFHWHLTDDQGWRIEIKKYPLLTAIGSKRKETLIGHNYEYPHKFDNKPVQGFYTQEEIKEIVRYAADRSITIVPEIELPGHATAAIAAYPELGVTGKRPEVVTEWGIFPDIFNVNDQTFTFLENVLAEVIELFPGSYIHIGGDEAIKTQWDASSEIQQKIKDLDLKDSHELQSYFIKRIEKFINSKGRKLIGWDEILEGGLAPNAAVMSWRGISGGVAAAQAKHNVVMTPGTHLYFDHYQGIASGEPLAIGGYLPISKVFNYEPVPDTLMSSEAKYIMGAQANVWTEYMKTPEDVEYMVFPRIAALAEVTWAKSKKPEDWSRFAKKVPQQLKRYNYRNIHYSQSVYNVSFKPTASEAGKPFLVELYNELNEQEIRYTLDGDKPNEHSTLYKEGIELKKTARISAAVFKNGKIQGQIRKQRFIVHKAYGKPIVFAFPYDNQKFKTTDFTLTDGIVGSNKDMFSSNWQRFVKVNLDATIDLGSIVSKLHKVSIRFANIPPYGILPPENIEVFVSEDGKEYVKAGFDMQGEVDKHNTSAMNFEISVKAHNVRFVRLVAVNKMRAVSPKGQEQFVTLMADELIVE